MNRLTILGILLAFLLVLAGCGNNTTGRVAAEDKIILGFIGPLTGDCANYGITERNAVEFAIDEINNAGGIDGKKLEVVYEDDLCTGKGATTAVQKLINFDKVKVIFGGASSSETLAAAPIVEENRVILISAFSSHPDISKAGDFVFRTSVCDSDAGYYTALYAAKNYKKVGVISENTDYSIGLRDVFVKEFTNRGGEIVADEVYERDSKDFRTQILKVKTQEPEAIILNPQTSVTAGLLVKQIRELGVDTPLVGNFAYSSKEALEGAGEAAEGMVFFDYISLTNEKAERFLKKYNERYNLLESDYEAGSRYDNVHLIANAIKRVGYDAEKIRDYLYTVKFSGTLGEYYFDENGDIAGIETFIEKRIKDGEVVQE